MGAYLSEPVTEKSSDDGEGNGIRFGASSMQGWRVSQEDAHNCVVDLGNGLSLYGVYDGHGGAEVAIYMSRHFPDVLKETESFKKGDYQTALRDAFLKIDADIKTPEVLKEIQQIAKGGKGSDDDADKAEENENYPALVEEAFMPLSKLILKYKGAMKEALGDNGKKEEEEKKEVDKPGSSRSIIFTPEKVQEAGSSASPSDSKKESSPPSAASGLSNIQINSVILEKAEEKPSAPKEDTTAQNEPDMNNVNTAEEKLESPQEIAPEVKPEEKIESPSKQSNSHDSPQENGNAKNEIKGDEDEKESTPITPKRKGKSLPPTPAEIASLIEAANAAKNGPTRISQRNLENNIYANFIQAAAKDMEDSEEDDEDEEGAEGDEDSDDSDDDEAMGGGEEEDLEDSSMDEDDDEEEEEDEDDEAADDRFLSDLQEPGYDSGTTANVALFRSNGNTFDLWVANAGDSRCIVSRDGIVVEMSSDHKPEDAEEARRIVTAGGKVTADGRVNGGLNLSRAIGDHSYKQNEQLPPEEQMITPLPDIKHIEINPSVDEFVVLACDGIWNSLNSQEVVNFVHPKIKGPKEEKKLSTICEQLFDTCMAQDTNGDGTGCDNMTAIVLTFPTAQKNGDTNNANLKRRISDLDENEDEEESKRFRAD